MGRPGGLDDVEEVAGDESGVGVLVHEAAVADDPEIDVVREDLPRRRVRPTEASADLRDWAAAGAKLERLQHLRGFALDRFEPSSALALVARGGAAREHALVDGASPRSFPVFAVALPLVAGERSL